MLHKRVICFLLITVMIFSSMPVMPVSAAIVPIDQESFLNYLQSVFIPPASVKGEIARYLTYRDYDHLVVYGKPYSPNNEAPQYSKVTKGYEHRYLGYTQTDQPYTNTYYPNDVDGSKIPTQWIYEPVSGAPLSWEDAQDTYQLDHMRTANLTFNGSSYSGLTANWIATTNTKPELRGYDKLTKLQNTASWKNGFSVYTLHKGANGKVYYATFNGPEMGGSTNVNCAITTPANTYTIKADQTFVEVPVTVTATANLVGTYVKPSHIKSLKASFLNFSRTETQKATSVLSPATDNSKIILSRSNYGPGTHTVTLIGEADLVSTLSDADKYHKQATKNITLIVEGDPGANLEITATTNPSSKQVDGSKDELVTVNVNATLKNYTNAANIKDWSIYAQLNGEDATRQTKDNIGGVITSSASFTFNILKSKFNVDDFTQQFKVTAIARLHNAIGPNSFYLNTVYPTSEFYKVEPEPETPPTDGNLPPIAILNVEETVKAGEETGIDGLGSYDTDGYIAGYNMNTTGATVTDSSEGFRNVWYPYTGQPTKTYKASVRVVDNMGAADADSKTITVTEPTIDAKIKVVGKLKVNRSVKITNTSKSPTHYPIDDTKTVWTLQAVSGGTNADIKFNGVLSKVNEINVIFKKQGVYKAILSVTNILGYSDTTEYLINIGPDLKPAANFTTATTVIRDVENYGNATMELQDTSYSLDGDIINSRIWTYAFDSDNDGSFTDETYKTFDSGNNIKPILKATTVGKYHIKLLAKETFTDTLPLYILSSDYLSDDTADKTATESIVEVINIAPTAAFSMIDKKKVDLIFNVWDTRYTKEEIETKINSTLVPALNANDIDASIKIADNYDLNIINGVVTPRAGSADLASARDDDNEYKALTSYTLGIPANYTDITYVSTNSTYGDLLDLRKDGYSSYSVRGKFDIKSGSTVIGTISGSNYALHDNGYDISRVWIKSIKISGGKVTVIYSKSYYSATLPEDFFANNESVTFDIPNQANPISVTLSKYHYYGCGKQVISSLRSKLYYSIGGTIYSKTDNSKYLNTLLSEQSIRANSQLYVVTVSDNQLEELADPIQADKVLAQTLEKNVNFVGLGTTANKTQLENYIKSNNNKGKFIDNINIDTAIATLKDYILGLENQEEPKTQYVVMGEELEYLTFYDDHEDDVKYSEQWKFTHTNPSYFDNGLGTDAQSGINRTLPITQFNKVGVYDVLFNVRDNPYNNSLFNNYKLWSEDAAIQLMVHRRPIAAFTPYVLYNSSTSKYYISTVDNSFDLDHNITRADKGIIQKLWKWKFTEDVDWQSGIPTEIVNGKTYQLQLVVQDIEGAWSLPAVETVNKPDILVFANPTSLPWQNTNAVVDLGVKVNAGTFSKVDYLWTNSTIKPTVGFASSTSISNNLTQTVAGVWYMHATAYTTEGQSAYNYFGPYQIDKTAPTIIPVKTGGVSSTPVTVAVTIADTGGSMIKDVKYRWTNTSTKPTSGWTVTNGSFSATQNQDNIWCLHIEATDNAGNITYTMVSVPYIAINANPTNLSWQNTNAVVNLIATITKGAFSKINYRWTNSTTKPTASWASSASTYINTIQSSTGIWYLHAEAYVTGGQSKYIYFGTYQIDKIAPTIAADKTNAEGSDPVTVNVTIDDTGGSGIKDVKYRWTNATTKPTTGWTMTTGSFSTTQDQEGLWYLHVEATDNAGNVTYKYLGTFKINTFILEKFRVVMVRDLHLEEYYYDSSTGRYSDKPMYANNLAVDEVNFGSMVDGLTKGYKFEFEIDSRNFNENADFIEIEPHFYTTDGFARDEAERDLYWEDSNHQIFKAGEGGHSSWKTITLNTSDRIIIGGDEAIWRGEYLIPGSAWAVPKGTTKAQAQAKDLKKNIIVNFHIKGYKEGVLKFDYNEEQWSKERTTNKYPYLIGDVIRYSWDKNCLDDINAKDNR